VLLGSNFMKLPDNFAGFFFTIFLHGGEFIFVLIEFHVSQHSFIPSYGKDIGLIKIYLILYCLISIIAMNSEIIVYEFLKTTSIYQNIVIYIVSFIFLVNFYLLYQWLTHRKNINVLNDTISIRRINFNEDNNISSINHINDREMNFVSGDKNEKNRKASVTDKNKKDGFDNDKLKTNILTNY